MSNISADVDDTKLDTSDDKIDILEALTDVNARYYEIGTMLHLKTNTLDGFKNKNTTYAIAMSSVVEAWLNEMYKTDKFGPPTWKRLVEVIASQNGGNNNKLAKTVAGDHKKKFSAPPQANSTTPVTRPPPVITSKYPNFFDDTQKNVQTDGWWSNDKKISFERYVPLVRPSHVSISFSFDTVTPQQGEKDLTQAGCYKMRNWPHGVALIINNEAFRRHTKREGTDIDEKNLVQAFQYLGYAVEVHRDCNASRIYEIMEEMRDRDHSNYDSFVCCILSHGKEGHIHGSDSTAVSLDTITSLLNGDSCKTLVGKPKIFILQACRGTQKDKGVKADGDDEEMEVEPHVVSDSDARVMSDSDDKIPKVADFFIGYATPLGHVAWRDLDHGSWYISELCRSLVSYAQRSNLETIMKITRREVGEVYSNVQYKQSPEVVTRLTKDVFFF